MAMAGDHQSIILYKYCTNIIQISYKKIYKYCTNTVQLSYKYCAQTIQILYNNYTNTYKYLLYFTGLVNGDGSRPLINTIKILFNTNAKYFP